MNYRAEIDGLRCVAVVAVVLFHARVPGFGGGFVGVDVFFVISGYLITGTLAGRLDTSLRSLLHEFYHRRARRLFPALFVALAASALAAAFVFMPKDFEAFGGSLTAAALFVSNWFFAAETDYFGGSAELKPLLHTWSLSVEEQFYVLFPALLWALWRYQKRWITIWLATLALASFAAGVWATEVNAEQAFFWSPYRAWELLIGSLLALNVVPRLSASWRTPIGLLGLALILCAVAGFSNDTAFPGHAALVPCAGAALIIYAGSGGLTARLLSFRPIIFIGMISYSLYLWHWPIFTFARYYSPGALEPSVIAALIALSFCLAVLSWAFVEQPFRRKSLMPSPNGLLASSAALSVLAAVIGFGAWVSAGWPERLSPQAQRYAAMYDMYRYFAIYDRGGCFLDTRQKSQEYDLQKCIVNGKVLLFGDSFAAHLYPGLRAAGIDVEQYTSASCRPFDMHHRRCTPFYNAFFDLVLPETSAGTIIVAGLWTIVERRYGREVVIARLRATLERLSAAGKRVILVGQSPTFAKPVPYLLAIHPTLREFRVVADDAGNLNEALRELASSTHAIFFDPQAAACRPDGCLAADMGHPYHWDFGHMTLEGSMFYAGRLAPLLKYKDERTEALSAR